MISVQRPAANDNHQISRALAALVVVLIALFGLIAVIVVLGTSPKPSAGETALIDAVASSAALASTAGDRAALSHAEPPEPWGAAMAASIDTLRAC